MSGEQAVNHEITLKGVSMKLEGDGAKVEDKNPCKRNRRQRENCNIEDKVAMSKTNADGDDSNLDKFRKRENKKTSRFVEAGTLQKVQGNGETGDEL